LPTKRSVPWASQLGRGQNILFRLACAAHLIGVFDAQDELTAVLAREA
jgi:hypothetical protein